MLVELSDAVAVPAVTSSGPDLFVVINPGSGEHDAQEIRQALSSVFAQAGRRFHLVPVNGPKGLGRASETAAAQARACGGALVAVGGDGTINTVAQAAWREGCALGVIPQGTFNLFGRDHGISQDLETAARALLRAQPEPVQVGEVNGRLFLVNASLGLYPQLLQDREAFKKQLGRHRWVALLSGLVTLFEWRRQLVLEIDLDGQRTVLTTPTLFIGNNRLQLERVGITPEVSTQVGQGCLGAVVVRPIGSWALLLLLVRGALGKLGEAEQVRSFAFRTCTVRMRGRRRTKVAADGEVGTMAAPLRFSVASRPLTLMRPCEQDRVPVE